MPRIIRQQSFDNWVGDLFCLYAQSWTNPWEHEKTQTLLLKRLKTLVRYLRQRRAGRNFFLFCVLNRSMQRQQNTTALKMICQNHYLAFHSIICRLPPQGRDWKQDLHQYHPSHLYLSELEAGNRLLTASQVENSPSPLYTHSQMSSGKNITLGKNYTAFLGSWICIHLRKGA